MKNRLRFLAIIALGAALSPASASDPQLAGGGVSLQPNPHGFGDIDVGDSSSGQIFTLQNDSADTLTIASASIGGFNSDQFILGGTTCNAGTVLDLGESCSALVTFAPTNAGNQVALLRIFYTQPPPAPPGGAEINAVLSGNGVVVPPPAVAPVPTPATGFVAILSGIVLVLLAVWRMYRRGVRG